MSSSQSSRASEAQLDSSIQQSYAHILKRINTTNFNNTINKAGSDTSDDEDITMVFKKSYLADLEDRMKRSAAFHIRYAQGWVGQDRTPTVRLYLYHVADGIDFVVKLFGMDLSGGWQEGLDKILEENFEDTEMREWISRRQSEASVRTA